MVVLEITVTSINRLEPSAPAYVIKLEANWQHNKLLSTIGYKFGENNVEL